MAADGSIVIEAIIDTSKIKTGMKDTKTQIDKTTKSTKGLGDSFKDAEKSGKEAAEKIKDQFSDLERAIGDVASTLGLSFGLDSLVNFGQGAIAAASDLQEVQNVVETAFGDMSDQVEAFAQTSKEKFGISELAAKQTAGTYMSMGKSMGIADQQAAQMSLRITALSGDMASFKNISQDVASTALSSIWTGETESLRQFGIAMTVANLEAFALSQGINKNWNEMTQAEQVQLRYNYVLEQTSMMHGDYVKTQDSWSNQNRELQQSIEELSVSIGEGLIDTLEPLIQVVNNIVDTILEFQESTGLLDDFFLAITGGVGGLLALKAADVIKGVAVAITQMEGATLLANAQMGIAAIAVGAFVMVLSQLIGAWDNMTGADKVVAALIAVATAAMIAGVALGVFQSALTLGIAAAAIIAGIAAIMLVINSANARAKQMAQMNAASASGGGASAASGGGASAASGGAMPQAYAVPRLATGAVIPPNREFMAVLGDQKSGRNLEAPEGLIRQIVREESGGGLGGTLTIRPAPGLTRYLSYELEVEKTRAGTSLVEGVRR